MQGQVRCKKGGLLIVREPGEAIQRGDNSGYHDLVVKSGFRARPRSEQRWERANQRSGKRRVKRSVPQKTHGHGAFLWGGRPKGHQIEWDPLIIKKKPITKGHPPSTIVPATQKPLRKGQKTRAPRNGRRGGAGEEGKPPQKKNTGGEYEEI